MEIKVYFCAVLYNEDTEIIQVSDVKTDAQSGVKTDAVAKIQDSKTTLSKLYQDGWRLIQAIQLHETNGYRLFVERG